MNYDLDEHFAALDAEMHQAVAIMRPDRRLQAARPGTDLMKPILTALNFFSKQCKGTPGLDYLVGIRGTTAEVRAERPELLATLRIEFDGEAAFRIGESRFGPAERYSTQRTGSAEDAVQECVEFIARHIARMRPELARDATASSSTVTAEENARCPSSTRRSGADPAKAAQPVARKRSLGPALTAERRRPLSR